MIDLDYVVLQSLEDLLEMKTGYVLDFSNNSFQRFVKNVIGIDIYKDEGYTEYCSKANKLRQIFEDEPSSMVIKLISSLVDYAENSKMKTNNLSKYDEKLISDIRIYIKERKSKPTYYLDKEIDVLFKRISTREASFTDMSLNERLKEIVNLLELLLKKENNKYRNDINVEFISSGFVKEDSVIKLRKKLHCFRHSSVNSLRERQEFSILQKEFLVDYGILICSYIYREIKSLEKNSMS